MVRGAARLSSEGRVCSYDRAGLGASDPRPERRRAGYRRNDGQGASDASASDWREPAIRGRWPFVRGDGGSRVRGHVPPRCRRRGVGRLLFGGTTARKSRPSFPAFGRFVDGSGNEARHEGNGATAGASRSRIASSGGPVGRSPGLWDRSPDWVEVWADLQRGLAGLSSDSVHVLALDSHHFIQLDQPDLVIEAIGEVVKAAQSDEALPSCWSAFSELGGRCLSP